MRREFILLLLGIIVMSTLSSLLSNYAQIETDKVLIDTVVGSVGAGNFSYWQLGHKGPLLIELTSLAGDADLYVSDTARPSYEIDRNNFSSVTCGKDLISIPTDFPRPIGIGVFGDWSHSVSEYSIKVFLDGVTMQDLSMEFYYANVDRPADNSQRKEKAVPKKADAETPRFFLRLLNILETFFEMVVL